MNCINDVLIQKYIDSEASAEEVRLIEGHISSCNKCEEKIRNRRILVNRIKKAVNQLANDPVEIPEFIIPPVKDKGRLPASGRLYYIVAAASVLLFILIITGKRGLKGIDTGLMEVSSVIEVDANLPVTEFPLIITVTDPDGNISEYLIK